MFHQVARQRGVAARGGVVQGVVAVVVADVDVDPHLFDQVPDRRQPAVRHVAVGVGFEALAVADARGGVERPDAGPAGHGGRQPGGIRGVAFAPPSRLGRPRRDVRVRAVRRQQPHRGDVGGVRGAPERRGAVDALRAAVVVRHVPEVLREPDVRIRPRLEQRLHDVQVGGLLLIVGAGLRVARPRRPLQVERREQRGGSGVGGDVRVGAPLDEAQREVEMPVHRGDLQRARAVAAHAIDVGPGVEQRQRHVDVPLAGGVQQRGQAPLPADALGVLAGRSA